MTTLIFAWRTLRPASAFAILRRSRSRPATVRQRRIFTVLDSVLVQPLPYRESGRLAGILFSLPGMGFDRAPQSLFSYFT